MIYSSFSPSSVAAEDTAAASTLHQGASSNLGLSTSVSNHHPENDTQLQVQSIITNILIAVIPVVVITFFLVLSRCYKDDENVKRKRRSMGETVCGPSSFEYLTPRVVKRQFSSDVPMSYNKSLSIYSSKDDLDFDSECLVESDLHGDGDITFEGNFDPKDIVYV